MKTQCPYCHQRYEVETECENMNAHCLKCHQSFPLVKLMEPPAPHLIPLPDAAGSVQEAPIRKLIIFWGVSIAVLLAILLMAFHPAFSLRRVIGVTAGITGVGITTFILVKLGEIAQNTRHTR